MLAAGPPPPPPPRPKRALAAVLLGLLTALLATAWLPSALRARREAAPPGKVALCSVLGTCRESGCHIGFPFGSDSLDWELRQATPDSPLPTYWSPAQTLELKLVATDPAAYYMGFELAAVVACPSVETGGVLELLEPGRTTLVVDPMDPVIPELEYLTHSCTDPMDGFALCGFVPEVLGSGDFAWTFRWTPPARGSGTVSFHVALNTADGDGSPSGDVISIGEVLLDEEPCPPRIDDLRVQITDCDPGAPGAARVELLRESGGSLDFIREAGDLLELSRPADTWPLAPDGCRPWSDGRSLVAWSVAPTCDLGGEGLH